MILPAHLCCEPAAAWIGGVYWLFPLARVRIRISMEAGQYGRTLLVLAREECA